MSDVVTLKVPFRNNSKAARMAALPGQFAQMRHSDDSVFWLKENAEVLNILESLGTRPGADALSVHGAFYEDVERRLGFFPQYYRFLLSICLDLEDLGVPGSKGDMAARWIADQGLVQAELSDLQRAEARRLCLRRGVETLPGDHGLDDRLRAFGRRSETFSLPNKKAAYELTHIVFYLSEYGRRDPDLDEPFLNSLRFAGTLAFLELNIDLLSEICIALRFAGAEPPAIWERWLVDQARRFVIEDVDGLATGDDYHPYLMVNWFMSIGGYGGFAQDMPLGTALFVQPIPGAGPLREISDSLYHFDDPRSADWAVMRDRVGNDLSDEARHVLTAAEAAVDFGAFFAGFARVAQPGGMMA